MAYEHFINYTDFSNNMKKTCPFFGCTVLLTNGSSASNYGVSISQDGNLTVNPNCGSSFCSSEYKIEVDIFCSINKYYNKTKQLIISK